MGYWRNRNFVQRQDAGGGCLHRPFSMLLNLLFNSGLYGFCLILTPTHKPQESATFEASAVEVNEKGAFSTSPKAPYHYIFC